MAHDITQFVYDRASGNASVGVRVHTTTWSDAPAVDVLSDLLYTGVMTSSSNIRITFPRAIFDSTALQTTTNWTIGVPAGSPALTVLVVTIVSSTVIDLTLSGGDVLNGGAYTVSLVAETAVATNDQAVNTAAAVAVVGAESRSLTVDHLDSTSPTTVSVRFSKGTRQISAANSDDALNPANYVLATLTVNSVTPISSSEVILNTSTQSTGTVYDWAISNIKDIAGNVVS